MADTRCAHPEYQLDVDLMVLEYLLFHTLKSCFQFAKPPALSANGSKTISVEVPTTYENILTMFDAFMRMFKATHADYQLSTENRFNISLLETILLVREHETSVSVCNSYEGEAGAGSRGSRYLEWEHQIKERQRSFEARSHSAYRQAGQEGTKVENEIFEAWSEYQSATGRIKTSDYPPSPLFGVLYRFIELSSQIRDMMGGDVNERLMRLKCDLMLQTALEVLSTPGEPQHHQKFHSCRTLHASTQGQYQVPTLGQIFAYGYNPQSSETVSQDESQVLINDMFSEATTDPDGKPQTIVEKPEWTSMRHATILEFQIPKRSVQDQNMYTARLKRLKHKYPYLDFQSNLLQCLEHFWTIRQELSMSGKPVLVQIEEGSIQGLSKIEFDEFLVNCGIKRDDHGRIIVGLNLESSLAESLFKR